MGGRREGRKRATMRVGGAWRRKGRGLHKLRPFMKMRVRRGGACMQMRRLSEGQWDARDANEAGVAGSVWKCAAKGRGLICK